MLKKRRSDKKIFFIKDPAKNFIVLFISIFRYCLCFSALCPHYFRQNAQTKSALRNNAQKGGRTSGQNLFYAP
jgi:hypothetical protein